MTDHKNLNYNIISQFSEEVEVKIVELLDSQGYVNVVIKSNILKDRYIQCAIEDIEAAALDGLRLPYVIENTYGKPTDKTP